MKKTFLQHWTRHDAIGVTLVAGAILCSVLVIALLNGCERQAHAAVAPAAAVPETRVEIVNFGDPFTFQVVGHQLPEHAFAMQWTPALPPSSWSQIVYFEPNGENFILVQAPKNFPQFYVRSVNYPPGAGTFAPAAAPPPPVQWKARDTGRVVPYRKQRWKLIELSDPLAGVAWPRFKIYKLTPAPPRPAVPNPPMPPGA